MANFDECCRTTYGHDDARANATLNWMSKLFVAQHNPTAHNRDNPPWLCTWMSTIVANTIPGDCGQGSKMPHIHYAKRIFNHKSSVLPPCHRKWSKIGIEVKFRATVASTFCSEHTAIETTTGIDIYVLNYVVYTQHFQCEMVFLERCEAIPILDTFLHMVPYKIYVSNVC